MPNLTQLKVWLENSKCVHRIMYFLFYPVRSIISQRTRSGSTEDRRSSSQRYDATDLYKPRISRRRASSVVPPAGIVGQTDTHKESRKWVLTYCAPYHACLLEFDIQPSYRVQSILDQAMVKLHQATLAKPDFQKLTQWIEMSKIWLRVLELGQKSKYLNSVLFFSNTEIWYSLLWLT